MSYPSLNPGFFSKTRNLTPFCRSKTDPLESALESDDRSQPREGPSRKVPRVKPEAPREERSDRPAPAETRRS